MVVLTCVVPYCMHLLPIWAPSCSQPLVKKILGHPVEISAHISPTVAALAAAAAHPDWQCLDDIDVPLLQHPLSLAIDEAQHQNLLLSATSVRSRGLVLSMSLPHAGDWLNVVPSSSLGLKLQDRKLGLGGCSLRTRETELRTRIHETFFLFV